MPENFLRPLAKIIIYNNLLVNVDGTMVAYNEGLDFAK